MTSTDTGPPQTVTRNGLAAVSLIVAVLALALAAWALAQQRDEAALQVPADDGPTTREFLLSSDFVNGSNRYHPDTLVAFEDDTIVLDVTNRGEDEHGFTVDGLGIADVIDVEATAEYTADAVSAGVYPYYCQLHEGHIRGQLVVLRR